MEIEEIVYFNNGGDVWRESKDSSEPQSLLVQRRQNSFIAESFIVVIVDDFDVWWYRWWRYWRIKEEDFAQQKEQENKETGDDEK